MRIVKIIFSPTGGTKRTADMLAETIPGEQIELDLTDAKESFRSVDIRKEDLTILAMPVYGGRAPVLAMERFRKLQGNGSKCILVAVYGNRDFEDTLVEMQDAAEAGGFCVIGAVAAIAEHSVVREYAAGRPDAADRQDLHRAAEQFLRAAENPATEITIPGNRPYTKPMSLSLVPKKTGACTGCGTCRRSCPAEAIDDHFIADKKKCISCMRCVGICPVSARRPSAVMVKMSAVVLKKECSKRKKIGVYL